MKLIWSYQKSGSEWVKLIITSCIYDKLVQDWQVADHTILNYPAKSEWQKTHRAQLPVETDSAIALLRHPLDIAVSAYRYRKTIDQNLGPMSTYEYLLQFCHNKGDATFNSMNGGNLCDYYRAICEDSRCYAIKYEHLVAEPGILWPVLSLMGCDFKPMQVMKYANGMTPDYSRSIDKRGFLGQIRTNQYKIHTTPTLLDAYNEAFPEFRKAGYECEHIVGE